MRLVSYRQSGELRCGVLDGFRVHAFAEVASMRDVVALGVEDACALADTAIATSRPVALADVELDVPLRPTSFRDFMAFYEHTAATAGSSGVSAEWFQQPVFYFSNPGCFVPTGADVAVPPGAAGLDFELEVGAVVGLPATGVAPADAGKHLFGLTIVNDWSARDLQGVEMRVGLGPAKGKDSATTMGPCLVTMDEFADARTPDGRIDLEMTVWVNGTIVGQDTLANMAWTFEELVAYAARGTTVRSGDVIGSGTAGNGGCLLERAMADESSRWSLALGDTVAMEVERLGRIENTVVAGAPAGWTVPRARPPWRPRNPELAATFPASVASCQQHRHEE